MTKEALELFSGIKYYYKNGPLISEVDALDSGINCQLLVHLALEELFGYSLPKKLLSQELYEDNTFTSIVFPGEPSRKGDIFFFGPNTFTDRKLLHLALLIDWDAEDLPQLLHATPFSNNGGGVVVWPLERFQTTPRYQTLRGIKRVK